MPDSSQVFLRDPDKQGWTAADRLRSNLDAAVSSRAERDRPVRTSARDYGIRKNVFWVPPMARWKMLQDSAKLPAGTEIKERGRLAHSFKIISLHNPANDALEAMKKENPNGAQPHRLPRRAARRVHAGARINRKNVLNKNYTQLQIDPANLAGLIDLIATLPLQHADRNLSRHGAAATAAKDILGPDPESSRSNSSSAPLGDLCAFAVQNSSMTIRGIDFDFGKEPADTFTRDQHPDLRADFVMANPPFNIKEWWDAKLEGDARWSRSAAETAPHAIFYKKWGKYGTPPQGNANFAWVQHMLHHLAPNGSMALLLANGSMSSNSSGEGDIRRALIEADLVECMVALPGNLFTNTTIPACIWFLTKNKAKRSRPGAAALRDRRGETLFIDARKLGFMKGNVLRDFSREDMKKVAETYHKWRSGDCEEIAGFCKSAFRDEIVGHDFVLTPGRYVGAEEIEDDGELFEDKMTRLISDLNTQFGESERLEQAIKKNLGGLGYGV